MERESIQNSNQNGKNRHNTESGLSSDANQDDTFVVSSEDEVSKSIISELEMSSSNKPKNEKEVKPRHSSAP